MKNKLQILLFVGALALGVTKPVSAQWKLGVLGGVDFAGAQTLPTPIENNAAKGSTGYILGIKSDQDLMTHLDLTIELDLTERNFSDNVGSQTWLEHLTYLQVPFLLKYNPMEGSVQPFAYFGPEVGIKVSATLDSNSIIGLNRSTLFSGVDLNLDAGAGLQGRIVSGIWLFAEARYSYGLANIYTNTNSGANSGMGDLRARDFKVVGGLMFEIY